MSDQQSAPVCYRHRNRQTYLRCVRCDKPICADCRIDAPVGFQCPDCVAEGKRSVRRTRTAFGGRATAFGGRSSGSAGLITKSIIGANVALFVLTLIVGGAGAVGSSITQLHALLAQINAPRLYLVELFGQQFTAPGVAEGGYFRMFTAMFMHFGAVHLLFNMVVLFLLGRVLEQDLGPARYLTAYLLSGLTGSVAVYMFTSPETVTAGASGAVYGLFGVLIMVNRKLSRDNQGLYMLLALNLVMTLVFGFSLAGHVGGLIGGLLCGAVLTFTPRAQRAVGHWVGFAVLLALLVVATLYQTGVLRSDYGLAA